MEYLRHMTFLLAAITQCGNGAPEPVSGTRGRFHMITELAG